MFGLPQNHVFLEETQGINWSTSTLAQIPDLTWAGINKAGELHDPFFAASRSYACLNTFNGAAGHFEI